MSALESEGYAVHRSVLAPTELAGLREAIADTIDTVARVLRTPVEVSAPDAPFDERLERAAQRDAAYATALFHAVMADVHRDERLASLSRHTALARIVADLADPLRVTGRVIRPRAMVPTLSHASTPWHQDVVRPSTTPGSCGSVRLACWIPLSDVDERTGALEVIPGRWESPLPHTTDAAGHFSIAEDCLPRERSIVPLRAGDVLVLDRFIPHRSLPMRAGRVRWAIVMWVKASPLEQVA